MKQYLIMSSCPTGRRAYQAAIARTQNAAERAFLQRRLRALTRA